MSFRVFYKFIERGMGRLDLWNLIEMTNAEIPNLPSYSLNIAINKYYQSSFFDVCVSKLF